MKIRILVVLALFLSSSLQAIEPAGCGQKVLSRLKRSLDAQAHFSGLIPITDGREIFVDFTRGDPKSPTFVFLNGLMYPVVEHWQPLVDLMRPTGANILRYDYYGQGSSLKAVTGAKELIYPKNGLTLERQAEDLHEIVKALGISGKVNLVGLSYGGAVATRFAETYPKQVERLVLMAPLVIPLDNYQAQGQMFKSMLSFTQMFYGKAAAQSQWDQSYRLYVQGLKKTPMEGVSESKQNEALFQMLRAAKDFDLRSSTLEVVPQVHMILASKESPSLYEDQLRAWQNFSPKSRGSLAVFQNGDHVLQESSPQGLALWLGQLTNGHPQGEFRVPSDMDLKTGKSIEPELSRSPQ